MSEHDDIKAILKASIDSSLQQISPMIAGMAVKYEDWLIETAMYALDQNGYIIVKRATRPAAPTAPAPKG